MAKRRPAAKRGVHDSAETRARLLAAARELFVESGFERVTVRDICRAADANVASVNYHFGDKLGLYREMARQAIDAIRGDSRMTMTAQPGASAEERLRHYVQTFLPRIAKPDNAKHWIGRLMHHETTAPTPLAPWIFAEAIMPRVLYLRDIIVELLDTDVDDARVPYCLTSVQSQCLFYRPDPFKNAVAPGWAPGDDAAVAVLADHIVRFSLAGIKAIKKAPRP